MEFDVDSLRSEVVRQDVSGEVMHEFRGDAVEDINWRYIQDFCFSALWVSSGHAGLIELRRNLRIY